MLLACFYTCIVLIRFFQTTRSGLEAEVCMSTNKVLPETIVAFSAWFSVARYARVWMLLLLQIKSKVGYTMMFLEIKQTERYCKVRITLGTYIPVFLRVIDG